MKQILADVRAFHDACGVPMRETPGFPSAKRIALRLDLNAEEERELNKAIERADIEAVADGIADKIYVLAGMALEFGIPLDLVWAEVQRANMAKVDPQTGKVTYRHDGKVLKPIGWTPPDIARALTGDLFEQREMIVRGETAAAIGAAMANLAPGGARWIDDDGA